MVPKERNRLCFAPIVIPRYESNGCVKVVFFHLLEETLIDEVPVRLAEPWIINCKVCVMVESMPASVASTILCKHHHGSNFRKRGYHIGALDCTMSWKMLFAKQKYFLLAEVCLNEYWNNLLIASYRHDFLS